MKVNGLSPQTEAVFEDISKLDCIKGYCLIGGTALSVQLNHRYSEDLDFCVWKKSKLDKPTVQWPNIFNELSSLGNVKKNLLGFDHCDFYLKGTKITFFVMDTKEPENLNKKTFLNNIVVADPDSIGIMKLGVMQHRTTHRDYYDIYSLLQSGISLESLINGVRRFSKYNFKTREIESLLVNGACFTEDKQFSKLQPKYNVTLKEIELFMIERIKEIHKILPCKASDKLSAICKEVKLNKKLSDQNGRSIKNKRP